MRFSLSAVALLACLAACGNDDVAAPSNSGEETSTGVLTPLGGKWTGEVAQPGFPNYSISVDADGAAPLNSVFARVTYPDQSCSGEWTAVARTTNTQYRIVEHISNQPVPPTCLRDVDLVLTYTASPRRLEIAVFVNGEIVAAGELVPAT